MKWRLLGALVGFGYAAYSGLVALDSTGGGHGTFMFLLIFAVPNLCGLYYPIMGWMAADLGSRRKTAVFGSMYIVNVIISTFIFISGSSQDPTTIEVWKSQPLGGVYVTAILMLPMVVFGGILLYSIIRRPQTGQNPVA